MMWDIENPPVAFHFKVLFAATMDNSDTSFQDVSGIGAKIETETYTELGENGFVYQFPKPPTYPNLVLKRGIGESSSPLVKWCKSVFEGGLGVLIEPMPVMIYLMNEKQEPIRGWLFDNAFPVSWKIGEFSATKNEIAIETIELRYSFLSRVI